MSNFIKLAAAGLALTLIVGGVPAAEAAKKKQPTAEQKKKYTAEALKVCRKKYKGYHITHVEVNWNTMRFTCWYR